MVVKLRTGIENANEVVREVLEGAIRDSGKIGLQVAAYLDGELTVDVCPGLPTRPQGGRLTRTRYSLPSPWPSP